MNRAPWTDIAHKSSFASSSTNETSLSTTIRLRPVPVRVDVFQIGPSALTHGPKSLPRRIHRVSLGVSTMLISSELRHPTSATFPAPPVTSANGDVVVSVESPQSDSFLFRDLISFAEITPSTS